MLVSRVPQFHLLIVNVLNEIHFIQTSLIPTYFLLSWKQIIFVLYFAPVIQVQVMAVILRIFFLP